MPGETETLSGGTSPSRSPRVGALAAGDRLGRYRVVERIGAGGMGVVYVADDPELDRRVALKVVERDGDAQAELVREAQAMASLQHPNVVAVHDVGVADGRVFVAMDLVEGRTLRAWNADGPRDWRQVVGAFLDAGRGLAAAHAAGLVHRDFKPDNVLVGDDGQVRVADFGLAHEIDALAPDRAGTPPYMAPEQHGGDPITEAADQFAFACATWEAVFGRRPFDGDDVTALGRAKRAGRIVEPPAGRAPRWLASRLRRALAPAPGDRYPTLAALLDVLARGLGRRRRAGIAIGVIAAAAIPAVLALALARGGGPPPCDDGSAQWIGVWDPARAAALRDAFAHSGRGFAAASATRAVGALDGFVERWRASRVAVCLAGERGEAPATDVAARVDCLDEARRGAGASIAVLVDHPTGAVLDVSDDIVGELDPPGACTSIQAADRPTIDPDRLARLETVRAWVRAGDLDRGLPVARAIETEARAAGDDLSVGIAAYLVGTILAGRDDAAADVELVAAADASTRARHWRWAAYANAKLVEVRARRGDTADLDVPMGRAKQAMGHLPAPDVRAPVELALVRADLARGRLESAALDCRAAIGDAEAAFGAGDAQVGEALAYCSDADFARGDNQAALDALTRAVALLSASRGDAHPTTADARHALGIAHRRLGHFDEALRQYRAALAAREAAYGPASPQVAESFNSIAVVLEDKDDHRGAFEAARRALAAGEQAFGANSRSTAQMHILVAQMAAAAGDLATARAESDRAFAIFRATPRDPDLELAYAQVQWAQVAMAAGDFEAARAAAAAGGEVLAKVGDPAELFARTLEGQALLAANRPADAIAPLEHAHDLVRPDQIAPGDAAEIELSLGQALWRSGRDRARALAVVKAARHHLAELDRDAPALRELDAWVNRPR